jgi:hypothetical protein
MKTAKAKGPKLSTAQAEELLRALKTRFEKNPKRHPGIDWAKLQSRLKDSPSVLWSLGEMERTGGEPDVIGHDKKTGEYTFCDCSAESPSGRRSVCFDDQALESRKEHKPKASAAAMAEEMGIELGGDASCDPEARRRALLRPPLQPGVRLPQRCRVLLRGPGLPRLAETLEHRQHVVVARGAPVVRDWRPGALRVGGRHPGVLPQSTAGATSTASTSAN